MRFDVAALGELLIDFTPAGLSPAGMCLYERNPGGAPANVLCALAKLGMRTAFIGKVGRDTHGDFLRSVLTESRVDTSALIADEKVFTTLAFVELSPSGERSFSFARKPGADTCLEAGEIRRDVVEQCRIFHFGSLSLTDEPVRGATLEAVKIAKKAGAIISYDPNYRAPLWKNEETAVTQMRSVIGLADCMKISDEEAGLLTGTADPGKAVEFLLGKGVSCVVITLGKNGAEAGTRTSRVRLPVPDVPVADTTGAGDAFWGGFLYQLLQTGVRPEALTEEQLKLAAAFGNATASLCVQKRGAIPAMPGLQETLAFMKENRLTDT